MKNRYHGLSVLLSVFLLLLSFAVAAGAAYYSKATKCLVIVSQEITGKVETDTYEYLLVPDDADVPMPEGSGTEGYRFALAGDDKRSVSITYEKPGVYDYHLYQLKDGRPNPQATVYQFGMLVKNGSGYTLELTPYTCENDQLILHADGVECRYLVQGTEVLPPGSTSVPAQTVTPSAQSHAGARTNDDNRVALWLALLAVGFLGCLVVPLLGLKRFTAFGLCTLLFLSAIPIGRTLVSAESAYLSGEVATIPAEGTPIAEALADSPTEESTGEGDTGEPPQGQLPQEQSPQEESDSAPQPVTLDGTQITVSGDGLEGHSITAVNGATEREKTQFLEQSILGLEEEDRTSSQILAFDLSLQNRDGQTVQPADAVQVTLNLQGGVFQNLMVYHFLDDVDAIRSALGSGKELGSYTEETLATVFSKECAAAQEATGNANTVYFEVMSLSENTLTDNGNGTASFMVDSFSYYWTWNSPNFGRGDGSRRLHIYPGQVGNGATYYIPVSQSDQYVNFDSSWLPKNRGYEITQGAQYASIRHTVANKSACEVTIKGGTPENTTIVLKYDRLAASAINIYFHVVRIPKHFIKDSTTIPVSIGIMDDSSFILSEPTKTQGGSYVRVNGDLTIGNTIYSANAYDLVKKEILDNVNFVQNAAGSPVWGLVDATGVATLAHLNWTESQIQTILQNYLAAKNLPGAPEEYRLIPYVVKVEMTNWSVTNNAGWFIDCIVIRKTQFTVSYQLELGYGYSNSNNGGLPNGQVVNLGGSHTVGRTDIIPTKTVTDDNEQETTYTATFSHWRDQDGNTYHPNDVITNINKDLILTTVWNYPDQNLGNLRIGKTVVNAAVAGMPDATQAFTFRVALPDGSYRYAIYDAVGQTVSTGTISNNETLSLLATQYAIIYDLPKDNSYTVTEMNVPSGYTVDIASRNGTITAGDTKIANFVNTWTVPTASLTVTKTVPAGSVLNRNRDFTFTMHNADLAGKTIGDVAFDATGTTTFTLRHGQTKVFTGLPVGLTYQVSEEVDAADGYTVSYKIGEAETQGQTASIVLAQDGTTVEFLNNKDLPATAVHTGDNLFVYRLLGGAGILLVALLALNHRRKRRS